MMVGITLMNHKCEICGGYNHELFANNILICEKCQNRIENPSLMRCPKCGMPRDLETKNNEFIFKCPNCGYSDSNFGVNS